MSNLSKYALWILTPLLFVVVPHASAYSEDYEGTDGTYIRTYNSDYASTTDTDWKIYNDFSVSGNTSLGCHSNCGSEPPAIPLSALGVGTTGTYRFQIKFYEDQTGTIETGPILKLIDSPTLNNESCGIQRASSANHPNYHYEISPDDSAQGIDLQAPNATTTGEWHTAWFTYDFDNNLCTGGIDNYSTTTIVSSDTYVNPQYISIGYVNPDFYFDDLTIAVSNLSEGNSTLTRFISTDPTYGETIATSTSLDYYVTYYVNSDDYVSDNTYIELQYQHALYLPFYTGNGYSLAQESFTSNVLSSGESTSIFNFGYVYATGTYNVTSRIYTIVDPPWWQFWADPQEETLATYSTLFFANEMTSETEYNTYYDNSATNWVLSHTWDNPCIDFLDFPCWVGGFQEKLLHGVPIGYAIRLYEIFSSTSTGSSTLTLSLLYPSGSPGYGHNLTLDVAGGITDAISTYDTEIATFEDTPWNTFMRYWEYLWYIALSFWIINQIFGLSVFKINDIRNNPTVTKSSTVTDSRGIRYTKRQRL